MINIDPDYLIKDSSLFGFLENLKGSPIDSIIDKTGDHWKNDRVSIVNTEGNLQYILSNERLNDLKLKGNIIFPSDVKAWKINFEKYHDKIKTIFNRHFSEYNISVDSTLYYESSDFTGWRTNSEHTGKLVYLTWNMERNKSYFMWTEGNNLLNYSEPSGWSFKVIDVLNEDPHWYSVYSGTNRIEIGLKLKPSRR